MLILVAVVLVSSGVIWLRLRSGKSVDLTNLKLPDVIQIQNITAQSTSSSPKQTDAPSAKPTAAVAALAGKNNQTADPQENKKDAAVTLTAAGTLAIEKNIRQSAYTSDTKLYDFTEMMSLLKPAITGNLNTVFLENLLMDDTKVSDTVVPACAADLPLQAGLTICMAGFDDAWAQKQAGVDSTLNALRGRGLSVLGLFSAQTENRYLIREINGIRIAMMQYTGKMSSNTRKKMIRDGVDWIVPDADAETIAGDLAKAKNDGADIRAVYLTWGKNLASSPTKEQRELAQQIADNGADVIIGAGTRVAQTVEYLTASDGRKVLCAWNLGTLMSDDRGNANRIGGFLLHLSFRRDENGKAGLESATYTPTYVWRYRQDDHYYYKCLAANKPAPDGMDSEQIRVMEKTLTAVRKTLEGSVVTER